MKGRTILKVCSILMMIGGILSAILGVVTFIGIASVAEMLGEWGELGELAELADVRLVPWMLYASSALVVVGAIVEIIASAMGLGACKAPEKAKRCVIWGIIVAALCVVSEILIVVGGGDFNIITLITGLVVPVLYIIGANMMKSAQNSAQ